MHAALVLATILGLGVPAAAQDAQTPSAGEKLHRRFNWLGGQLTDRDLVLWLAGVEFGVPAGPAFNSRYFHRWGEDRGGRNPAGAWRYFTVSLSPGINGGRIGLGFGALNLGKPLVGAELRAAMIRTWRNPISTEPNLTFAGPEARVLLFDAVSAGIGYYWQVSPGRSPGDRLLGGQIGLGF
jgi:hypothetical protein